MRGVFQIAKFSGIPVQLHWSFSLLFFWILYVGKTGNMSWVGVSWLTIFVLSMFACVVMHEFGHALSARRFGVGTKDIILSPIGGVARLERLPEKPEHEFLVAIAGPLVNVVIALILGIGLYLTSSPSLNFFDLTEGGFNIFSNLDSFLGLLFYLNISLFTFNLLPAFPMDGGRIFRSLLSIKLGRLTATRIASYVGQFMAFIFIFGGAYFGHFVVCFIGIFVFLLARQEYKMVKTETYLNDHKVGDVARSHFTKFTINDSISEPITTLKQGLEKNFLIYDELDQLSGVLYEKDILQAMKNGNEDKTINDFYNREYDTINSENSLRAAYNKMMSSGFNILPVTENNQIVGVIDVHSLNNFIRLKDQV